jgi:transmembrane sensor
MTSSPSSNPRIEARTWVLVMADAKVSAEDQAAFRRWYDASETNASAYERELDLHYALEPLRIRFAENRAPGARWRRPRLAAAAAIALAASIGLAVFVPQASNRDWQPSVATDRAEVREIELPDGSRITLGPQTQVEMAFTASERRVRLSSGEAYFAVAHDQARPFVVEAQGAVIRDIGTEFEVKSGAQGIRVTVAHGIVDVVEPTRLSNLAGARVHRLVAGQQVSLTPTALSVQTQAAPAPALPAAWREGFLIYENATLAEVVADANRYSPTPIVIDDPAIGRLRVTTAYRTDQIDQMLSIVGASLPVTVSRGSSEIRLSSKS